jgi:hypothetical protein
MGRSLAQILLVLLVLLGLANMPLNQWGTGLAHLLPDSPALVMRDGMLLQGSKLEIYLLEKHQLRLISSPEALERFFRHRQVYRVEDSLLAQLGQGRPIHRLVRCPGQPGIYALENGRKYRVQEPSLTEPIKPWDRVELVSCDFLMSLPAIPLVTAGQWS